MLDYQVQHRLDTPSYILKTLIEAPGGVHEVERRLPAIIDLEGACQVLRFARAGALCDTAKFGQEALQFRRRRFEISNQNYQALAVEHECREAGERQGRRQIKPPLQFRCRL